MNQTIGVLIWLLVACIMVSFITSPLVAAVSFVTVFVTYLLVREKDVPEGKDEQEDASKE